MVKPNSRIEAAICATCPDAVAAEELVLVEHSGKDAAQPALVDESNDAAFRDAKLPRPGCMHRLAELRHAPEALVQPRRQGRNPFTLPPLYDRGGTER